MIKEKHLMKKRMRLFICFIFLFALFPHFLSSQSVSAFAEDEPPSKVTFYVHWYDVGKSALEGLKGVRKVEKGFRHAKEINRVTYDPTLITIEEMEAALKRAETYRATEKQP